MHVSDLHNKQFGRNQKKLVDVIEEANPDFIIITGDIIDSRLNDDRYALILLEKIVNLSKVYYVTGNHEWRSKRYGVLKKKMEDIGIHILSNDLTEMKKEKESIYLLGVDDPRRYSKRPKELTSFKANLKELVKKIPSDTFKILLSHRPEMISFYSTQDVDLVFSGHAHGGQIRLPVINGLFSPNQGFFPKYAEGVITQGNTKMIVSRGLGNTSIAPLRLFNRPEVIIVTLKSD